MKRVISVFLVALLCVSLLLTLTACAETSDSDEPGTSDGEMLIRDPFVSSLKIAVCGDPAWSMASDWFYSEDGQLYYNGASIENVVYQPATLEEAVAGLADGTYDMIISLVDDELFRNQSSLYENGHQRFDCIPVKEDAIAFMYGNPTREEESQPGRIFALTTEEIRSIYGEGMEYFWETNNELVPCLGYDDGDSFLWQYLEYFYDIVPSYEGVVTYEEATELYYLNESPLYQTGETTLYPVYYSTLTKGEASGTAIAVDSYLPIDYTIMTHAYPLELNYYAIFLLDHPYAEYLQDIAAYIQANNYDVDRAEYEAKWLS